MVSALKEQFLYVNSVNSSIIHKVHNGHETDLDIGYTHRLGTMFLYENYGAEAGHRNILRF